MIEAKEQEKRGKQELKEKRKREKLVWKVFCNWRSSLGRIEKMEGKKFKFIVELQDCKESNVESLVPMPQKRPGAVVS